MYLVIDGLKPKLSQINTGPYFVQNRTTDGNYILKDTTGELLDQSYPLNKLRLTEPETEPDNNYEIDKILSHRELPDGHKEYLVKWTGYSDEHNTWTRDDRFN